MSSHSIALVIDIVAWTAVWCAVVLALWCLCAWLAHRDDMILIERKPEARSPEYVEECFTQTETDPLFDVSPKMLIERFSSRTRLAMRMGKDEQAHAFAMLTCHQVWKFRPEYDPHPEIELGKLCQLIEPRRFPEQVIAFPMLPMRSRRVH